ncbi:MAG: SLC45 family MFS transporter [Anaerolineales bacterium]|nr:SLC45 family MFS transporter [Chloroflexota bacterium]MBL7161439.1 SLC45 family MFS transporter [Anaerolineales bacterium]
MKFNYGKIFLLGFGFFGVSVIWSVYNAFVPIFLADRFGLAPVWIGFFMTLDNIAALLIQPPVGAWSDKLRTPVGRRMPFILIGAPIAAIAFGIIPMAAVLPLFVACSSTLLLSMALWRTPVVALMPDITPSPKRSQANGIINFMGGVGAIIAFLIGSKLYSQNIAFPFWMGSGLVLLSAVLVFIFIKEPKEYEETEAQPNMFESLREVWNDSDKSALRLFLAIFFWFVGYNAIEAFFTLYSVNQLHLNAADGASILGHLSLFFVLFALVSGFVGSRVGRRVSISIGLILLVVLISAMYVLPPDLLANQLTQLPVLGTIRVISLFMMAAGAAWALININSLPMVVDMVEDARIGTFTGLYYLFATLAAIAGPNVNGLIIQLSGKNYNTIMLVAPFFMACALILMWGVRRGEAKVAS